MVNYMLPRHAMELNTQPIMNALAGYRQQQNHNQQVQTNALNRQSDMDWRQAQADRAQGNFDANQAHRGNQLALQKAKMAQGPARPWWAGQNGQIDPAMERYRAAGRPTTNVNVNSRPEASYDKEAGKQYAKDFIAGQKGAGTARRDLNNLQVMQRALDDPNLYSGSGGQTIQALKKTAQTLFGVPVQGVSSGEIVQNLSKNIAVGLKENLPGPLSDSDRRFLVEMAPGLSNSPDGNRMIIQLGMLQKQWQIAKGQAARDYAKANGGRIDAGFYGRLGEIESDYARQFSGLIAKMQQSPTPPRLPTAGIPQITSPQMLQQLPSGSKFQAPDGSIRIKP